MVDWEVVEIMEWEVVEREVVVVWCGTELFSSELFLPSLEKKSSEEKARK